MLTASDAVDRMRQGLLSPVDLLDGCLSRIERLDGEIQAWVTLDRDGARLAARQRYEATKHGAVSGVLFGVPVGIKDIFDVGGLPTKAGAGDFAHYTPEADSTVVARLRDAGAIILGKTATTEFAFSDPAPTRNPWDLDHTPGGSSSGSAAAVASGMVPIAIGSQTIGSTLRPAAYCGIVGLKPTHGRVSLAGAVPLSWSLDHCGIFARSVADAALVLAVVAGKDPADPLSADRPVDDYAAAVSSVDRPPRVGWLRGFYAARAEPQVVAHIDDVAARLSKAGEEIVEVKIDLTPDEVLQIGNPVLRGEAAASHRETFASHAEEYRPRIRALIESGLELPAVDYVSARLRMLELRSLLAGILTDLDALLLPVAPGPAPAGLDSTGDPVFCAPASTAGLPAIALPSGVTEDGLPLAVQLVAARFAEQTLLRAAAWTEKVLDFTLTPPLADGA